MEKYLKGNIKNKNDYSDTSGKAYVYSIRIWDGVFISANCIYKEEIIHKGFSKYDMIFVNCCLDGRCEVHFPDDSYVYREEMEISDKLASLDSEEQEEYIASLQGQDTMKNLRRKFDELFYKAGVYEKVLMKHHVKSAEMKDVLNWQNICVN